MNYIEKFKAETGLINKLGEGNAYLCWVMALYLDRNDVKRNNISYNMSLPVWRAIFLPCSKKPYSAGFAAMQ